MEKKTEFGYTAETQSEQRRKNVSSNHKPAKDNSPREKELASRALENIKLPRDLWNSLIQDIQNGAGKKTICKKYGIKAGYFKYIKQIVGVE